MQRRSILTPVLIGLLAITVAACSGPAPGSQTAATTSNSNTILNNGLDSATNTPSLVRSAADQPVNLQTTPVQTTPEKAHVTVWWPDELYPATENTAADILQSQIELFQITYNSYDVEIRRKRTSGTGGILATLRTAAPVAPSALPDLTLMQRTTMMTAATEGLIVPLDDWVPADLAGSNLFPGTRTLGMIDDSLYGIPYALTLVHTVYRQSIFAEPPTTFDDVLSAETPYLFSAGETPVSWTVLLQYFAAGGRLMNDNGGAALTPDALITVLDYYAEGVHSDVFDPLLLEHSDSADYWNAFVTGKATIASMNSHTYLTNKDTVQNVGLSSIPTEDGQSLTTLDGWMWVVTTQNPDRQQRALAFLAWMMRVSQQSAFTESIGMIPSQTRALRLWDDETYADFAETLVTTAIVLPEERRNNMAASALQDAVIAVLRGTSPETAADEALSRLGQ